ncbi:MAG TPA: DUF1003 domain-containing protein [Chthoniobacterales bacterium]|nr:DUF1003 domain-containing protein [Chthoniobacterales bacterium]
MNEGESRSSASSVPLASLRPALQDFIRTHAPEHASAEVLPEDELNRLRTEYVSQVLQEELGELTALEQQVIESLRERELLSANIDAQFDRKLTVGEWCSDKIAEFGGSWKFIILFALILVTWIAVNAFVLANRAFDPYPFILLNLVLSCVAALQAPIIMMSQNRVEARDRVRAEHDYKINLKAELEIRHLHEKMDHLLKSVVARLFETQQIQLDLLREMAERQSTATSSAARRE